MVSISTRKCTPWTMLFVALTLPLACHAALQSNIQPAPADDSAIEAQSAPVKLDGHTLFSVRGVSAYPAEQRAQLIADHIESVARDRAFGVQNISLNQTSFSTQIVAGDLVIVSLFDADARLEHVRRETLASANLLRIQEAIEDYRQERQANFLIKKAALAAAAMVGLLLLWFLGSKILKVLLRSIEQRYKHRIREIEIQSLKLLPAERMWRSLTGALKLVGTAVCLAATYVAFDYILWLFPWTREFSDNLAGFVLKPVQTIGGKFIDTIPNLIFLVILGVIVYYLLKFIRILSSAIENETITIGDFDSAWAKPTYRLVRGFVIAFSLVVAFPYIPGSETQAFKGVSLFLGLVFSLGSTSLIGNLISGYSLTYRRVFKPGDRVKIGEHVGDVQESRLLVTYLHTMKNEVIAVPNSSIVNDAVVNYSALARSKRLILHSNVGIGYETPWRQVEAMLIEAAARTPGLLREPQPFVLEKELRTFDVDYEINVYCDNPNAMNSLYAALHRNILDVFNEYGVQIMTPAYEGDPEDVKVVPRDRWYAAPAVPESSRSEVAADHQATAKSSDAR